MYPKWSSADEKKSAVFFCVSWNEYFKNVHFGEICNKTNPKWLQNGICTVKCNWNRYQFSVYRHLSENAMVTRNSYMVDNRKIWYVILPYCQVLIEKSYTAYTGKTFQKITIRLHLYFTENVICDKWENPGTRWKTRKQTAERVNLQDFGQIEQKGLQSFFFYGMISVDSCTHFEGWKNFSIHRNVTFM